MPMGSNCEVCGAVPGRIASGPFAGQRGSHTYCENCSKDLCDSCIANGHCRESADGKHKGFSDDDGEVQP